MTFYRITRNRNRKSVYFSSFRGQYSDSPRAISEALHTIAPDIEQVWQCKDGVEMPSYITKVRSSSDVKKAIARADAWVMSGSYQWKAKGILSVAVWHGDRGFKRVAFAAKEAMGKDYKKFSKKMSWDNVDLFTAGSDYGVMQAQEGFHYRGEIISKGLPRNDRLVNEKQDGEYANRIRQSLKISPDVKILLFAPTFRDGTKTKQKIDIDLEEVMNILQEKGEKWICLLRSHTSSKGLDTAGDYNYLDVSGVGDMADLLLITDCLITDYSSSAGDFILTNRPCILVHFDIDEYQKNSRSLWFNPDDSGFLIAKNQGQLNNIVRNLYSYDHVEIARNVNRFYRTKETGKSSMIVAERIKAWVLRKKLEH